MVTAMLALWFPCGVPGMPLCHRHAAARPVPDSAAVVFIAIHHALFFYLQDVDAVVTAMVAGVLSQAEPLELAWRQQLQELQESQTRCQQLQQELEELSKRTANV